VLPRLPPDCPVFRSACALSGFRPIQGNDERLPAEAFRGEPVGLLAGIAKPDRFRKDLEQCGARIVWSRTERDHYPWQPDELARLLKEAQEAGARAVVTTGKDAVKMKGVAATPIPLYRAELECRVLEQKAFDAVLDTLPRKP